MKKIYISLIAILAFSITLVSCGSGDKGARQKSDNKKTALQDRAQPEDDDENDPNSADNMIIGEFTANLNKNFSDNDISATETITYEFKKGGDFTGKIITETSNGFVHEVNITGRYKIRGDKLRIKYNRDDYQFELTKDPFETEEQRQAFLDQNLNNFLPAEELTIKEFDLVNNEGALGIVEPNENYLLVKTGVK